MVPRRLQLWVVPALLASGFGHGQAPQHGEILAPLTGVRNLGKGQLICLLYKKLDRVDGDVRKAWRVQRVPATARDQLIRLQYVPPGEYALAVFHDLDGDGKLATTFLGVPDEDLAISRNAKGGPLGGPKWANAKVELISGVLQLQPLVMHPFYD